MSILQGRARRYGKACDHKVSGSGGSGWERSCLSIHRCMDHVSEVCQRASPLPAGKDWKQYGAQISRTTLANWIIYCSQNYFQPMYDYFHRELLKRSFAMADETRVQVLKEEGRQAQTQTQSFMWLFRSGEDGLPAVILYGYSPTRSGSHARAFLEKATADTWKRMDIRDTTIFRGSDAALVGRISVDTLSTPFPKENSMTTASRQCRASSTAAGCSPLRTPLTKSIPVIMKSGSSCVSRRKNPFWRLSGRGSISRSPSGIPGWIKP